jgi:charged multivesicular body protein 1
MGNKVSLEEELINLRITAKQMQRSAKKCESSEKAALDKLKKVRSEWLNDYGRWVEQGCSRRSSVTRKNAWLDSVTVSG